MAQRILIIEDEAPIRAMLTDVLEEEGYEVAAVAGIEAGLRLVPGLRPNLILCDLLLPPQNGRQFYDRLSVHPQLAPIPVIFITALPPGEADRRLIGDLQHVPVLYKPIQVPELLTAVEMFIDHGP